MSENCIGNTYVQLIEKTECIGNSLIKINENFAQLDAQVCILNNAQEALANVEGILKSEEGQIVAATSGTDYYKPGTVLSAALDVSGNLSSAGSLTITGNTILQQNLTIGATTGTSITNIRGKVILDSPFLTKGLEFFGSQINASPLVNAEDTLLINYTGFANSTSQYRNLNVCDGKQTSLFYVDAKNSKIGIKTTTPAATLHIFGDLKVEGSIISNTPLDPNVTVNLENLEIDGASEGQILTYTGGAARWAPMSMPTLSSATGTGIQIFDTPGAWTWTCPPNVTRVTIEMFGGGGGGSTSYKPQSGRTFRYESGGSYNSAAGVTLNTIASIAWSVAQGLGAEPGLASDVLTAGGGGGGHAVYTVAVVPGTTYNLFVGDGGDGGTIPDVWINYENSSQSFLRGSYYYLSPNTDHMGKDGQNTTCNIGGVSVVAEGGKGGGTRKEITNIPNLKPYTAPCGGDGGGVPLVASYTGQGIGGTFNYHTGTSGTGSNGGYGGESGDWLKGGGTGTFSCGGVGGAAGKSIRAFPASTWHYFQPTVYNETADSKTRNGSKYGGGGAPGERCILRNKTDTSQWYVRYDYDYPFLGYALTENGVLVKLVKQVYFAGKGANGAVLIRY
jgi:hypothetical protein